MPRLILLLSAVLLIVTVAAVVDASFMPKDRVRGIPKAAWIVVILLVPVIGPLLWLTVGRRRAQAVRYVSGAPDDDPAFLAGLNADERVAKLEEELARLEEEERRRDQRPGDDPGTPRG